MPQALAIDWKGVRQACEAGLPLSEAAARFNIPLFAVRKRAHREKWITPNRAANIVKKHFGPKPVKPELSTDDMDIMGNPASYSVLGQEKPGAVTPVSPEIAVAESIASGSNQLRHTLLKLAQQGANRALAANLAVRDWDDASKVATIAAKAAGWDKQDAQSNQVAVQVLFDHQPDRPRAGGGVAAELGSDLIELDEEAGWD